MAALGGASAVTSLVVLGVLLDWRGRWRALGAVERVAPAAAAAPGTTM
jgi:hypothetical protein